LSYKDKACGDAREIFIFLSSPTNTSCLKGMMDLDKSSLNEVHQLANASQFPMAESSCKETGKFVCSIELMRTSRDKECD
jgi:hypothetical protein